MLRVEPVAGSALAFVHEESDKSAEALADMWHGGCRVTAGTKWTLQQFKELPDGDQEPPAVDPSVGWRALESTLRAARINL